MNKIKYQTVDAISTYVYRKETKRNFDEWLDKVAEEIRPCSRTIAKLENYLIEKYDAKKVEISDFHLKIFKANIIMSFFPELLTTPQIKFDTNKKLTKNQMKKFVENSEKRYREAMEYPMDKLQLDMCVYEFSFIYEDKETGQFKINIERTTEQCTISFSGNTYLTLEQEKRIDSIIRDIVLFQGVTQDDIDKRTPRFMRYVTTLRNNQ